MSIITNEGEQYAAMKPAEFREIVRRGEYKGNTVDVCKGRARFAMAVVPKEYALDFFLLSQNHPSTFPILDVTEPGSPHPMKVAPKGDLRTDLTNYHVFINGELDAEVHDITPYWRDDLVGFLTGCAVGFNSALEAAGITHRMLGVYNTNRQLAGGRLHGTMRTSGRLVKSEDVVRTIQIASRFPAYHGAPFHVGDPAALGIKDIYQPDVFSSHDGSPQAPDEVAMFWGCGMSLKAVAMGSKIPLMITEGVASMFVSDMREAELAVIA
ncbi:D-glutamate cyclase family protein [Chloroflexota bacterium]